MRDVTPPAAGPTRRLVTAGALGAVVATLAGCGIRLEDDAPRVPLVPTREPIEAEDALLRLLAAVRAAAVAPLVTTDPLAPLLPTLHSRQEAVLHDALRQRGVPEADLARTRPSPTPTGSPTPPGSPTPGASSSVGPTARRTVADVESSIIAAGTGLSEAEAELRPTLVCVLAQAGAAVLLSPQRVAPASSSTPTATPSPSSSEPAPWSAPEVLAPLIAAVRRATFLLEVAAARSPRAVRTEWLRDIATLQALTADLVGAAGEAAPLPDLTQTLPRPVTTAAEAATLASEAMATLLATTGAGLRALTGADPGRAFASAPGWVATVAATAHRHGIRLTPFPGLA